MGAQAMKMLDELLNELDRLRNGEDEQAFTEAAVDALPSLISEIRRMEESVAEAQEYATASMRALDQITTSATELEQILREKWNTEIPGMSLCLAAILSAFATAWKDSPPENGVVQTLTFADIGKLELQIRRVDDGKTAAQVINEQGAEILRLQEVAKAAVKYQNETGHIHRLGCSVEDGLPW